eukprot:TRINITY_DN44780_c0_g1_i2.p1 TRINITY_DN44780_c0_g1~~TRINITY_DN44780_c0_g1_i2.p1  ORF type:complete len:167 (-),score=19.91 TRINITY_DN44780_c0_g1_i2:7-507(-)
MLGLWGNAPSPTLSHSAIPGRLGPNMTQPQSRLGARPATWPSLLQSAGATDKPSDAKPCSLVGPVSPVWVRTSESKAAKAEGCESVNFIGRWFLDHTPDEIQHRVLAEAACNDADNPPAGEGTLEVEEMSLEDLQALRAAAPTQSKKTPTKRKSEAKVSKVVKKRK